MNQVKYSGKDNGHTMIELIVVLAIIGIITTTGVGIGLKAFEGNRLKAFEEECEMLLKEIEATRNAAIMANQSADSSKTKNTIEFNGNEIIIKEFTLNKNPDKNYSLNTRTIQLSTMTVPKNKTIAFSAYSTIGGADTITLKGPNGATKNLVFQIDTGRIYLE